MKKIFLISLILTITNVFSQKKDKIKGSKIITHTIKQVENFQNIEVEDNLEIYLVKADTSSIEIEADDNLHDIINFTVAGNTLHISTLKQVSSAKKFSIRINYAAALKSVTARHESKIHALNELELEEVTIKNFDQSSSFLNVNAKQFTLILNDKSEAEINVKSENCTLEISKNAELKALIASTEIKADLYEKAEAKIEGDTNLLKLRVDNSSNLIAEKLTAKNIDLTIENYAKCKVRAQENISISASGKTLTELYGDPKIEIKQFTNNATLKKDE